MVPRVIFFSRKNIKKLKFTFLFTKNVKKLLNLPFLNIFYYINLHSDPFGSGSESERFDRIRIRIRILQNVRILSDPDLDSDSDPQHWLHVSGRPAGPVAGE